MKFIDSLIPLFDIDWTLLIGKNPAHHDAFKYMFTVVFNQPTASIADIVPHGMIDAQIIVEILKVHGIPESESKPKLSQAFMVMNKYYAEHANEKDIIKLPGVDQLLVSLKDANVLMGVLSGNIEGMAWNKMTMAKIRQYFPFGAFGDMALRRSVLVNIAKKQIKDEYQLDIPFNKFVIVGDSPLDIACAIEAGTKSIGVATGSYTMEQLKISGADLVVSTLEELNKVFRFITD